MIPDIEKQSTQDIKEFQETKLKDVLQYVSQNSPYYQRMFKNIKFQFPKSIHLKI